jgi:outer membrane protein OmpA-like peptidoglycan-associated protein
VRRLFRYSCGQLSSFVEKFLGVKEAIVRYANLLARGFFLLTFSFLLLTSGCVATQDWVKQYVPEQLFPLNKRISDNEVSINQMGGRVSGVEGQVAKMANQIADLESRLSQTNAKADRALESLQRLKPERKMVLNFTGGAQFATNSIEFSSQAKKEIDSFLSDIKGDAADGSLLFVVAGHTDGVGSESFNYDLSKRRAENVAAYLMTERKIDPSRVLTVGYGERAPVADNRTEAGRAKNRRVEILVYRDTIAVDGGAGGARAGR